MPTYRYLTADVFTGIRFGGNPLAVLPNADGLTSAQMLAITREFNYSESTFVFPAADAAHSRRVRIFTPRGEIPFAGHPTVGTAFVLASIGDILLAGAETRIVFEENVGPVPVLIRAKDGKPVFCQLTAAKLPEIGHALPSPAELARVLSLDEADILVGEYGPQVVSTGLAFAFVPLRDRGAVRRARLRVDAWEELMSGTDVFLFAMDAEEPGHHVRARAPGRPTARCVGSWSRATRWAARACSRSRRTSAGAR